MDYQKTKFMAGLGSVHQLLIEKGRSEGELAFDYKKEAGLCD